MTIPLPVGLFTNNTYFYANNSFTLGSISKPVNARTLVSVDYSQLPGGITGGITAYWFEVDVGSNPPLTVSNPNTDPGSSILTFLVSNGVPGVSYQLSVSMTYGEQTRTDILSIEIPASDGCCGTNVSSFPLPGAPIAIPALDNIAGFLTGEGLVFINTGIRYFVSAVPPQSANILDQWYNSTTRVLSELTTDGANLIWMPLNQYTAQVFTGQTLFMESLTIALLNTFPPLTHLPDGAFIAVVVNKQTFFPLGLSPPFHLAGQTIGWDDLSYQVNPGDDVKVFYTYTIV